MGETIVPLISSSSTGTLGVCHLPRLWWKILAHAQGRLAEGYRHGNGGFDETTCENIGIDPEALVRYIETEKPDYVTLEAWVREHATKLTPEAIAAHNDYIRGRRMNDEKAQEVRARLGVGDERVGEAITLNDLDDWNGAHAVLVGRTPAVP